MEDAQTDSPSTALFARASSLTYPDGMVAVPEMISGMAFFPGGHGLYAPAGEPLPDFPLGGVMVVGQDFDTEANYRHSRERQRESEAEPTWRNLLALLDDAGADRSRCFFTNAYMGLRTGASNTGRSPGSRSEPFSAAFREIFVEQLIVVRPRVIVLPGNQVLAFVYGLTRRPQSWRRPNWGQIDDAGEALMPDLEFIGTAGRYVVPAAAAVVHPSFRHANVGRRRFEGAEGRAAESRLLRAAMERTERTSS